MNIDAKPLATGIFSQFGAVLQPGDGMVKSIRDGAVRLSRSNAALAHEDVAGRAAVEFYECVPAPTPLIATRVEQHPHSMQLFAPMQSARWLVVVWPDGPASTPSAFVAQPDQAILYHPGIWHHGIVALDRPAQFLSMIWRTDGPTDTVFADLDTPVTVTWPDEAPT